MNESGNVEAYDNDTLFKPKIAVCGVGGGGSNTVHRLSNMGIKGVTLIAINTDAKHLNGLSSNVKKMLIGGPLTKGLGAGGFPAVGKKAADYSRSDIAATLSGYNLVFVCAGMGGGTGTGAAPVVANVAKENGAIVISVVTFPFALEKVRLNVAKEGIEDLRKNSDTLIVIDNQKLVELYKNLSLESAFNMADEVASKAVRGISETITQPSMLNLDFADVKNVMTAGGLAFISIGEGSGTNRIEDAVMQIQKNKLLDVNFEGAKSALVHVTCGRNFTLGELNEISRRLTESVAKDANVVIGARNDDSFGEKIEVIAIFTGVKSPAIVGRSQGETDSGRKGSGIDIPELF
ncbi:MAG: cell division protein FtsZ [Candidatus Micrarchaeaceae archaeon]